MHLELEASTLEATYQEVCDSQLRATLYWSLRALDLWYKNYVIGQEARDGPSTLYNRPWRRKWPQDNWIDEKSTWQDASYMATSG